MFRKAVELKPEHEEAAAELRRLAPEPPPEEEAESERPGRAACSRSCSARSERLSAAWSGAHRGLVLAAILALGAAIPAAGRYLRARSTATASPARRCSRGRKTFRVQTPYGRLVIPRAKVERIVHDDGSEEVLNAPEAPPTAAPASAPAPRARDHRQELLARVGPDPKGTQRGPDACASRCASTRSPLATYVDAPHRPGGPAGRHRQHVLLRPRAVR